MTDANTEVEKNRHAPEPKPGAGEKRGFEVPIFAAPGIFGGIAEQNAARAKENFEKMKTASGEIATLLQNAYSTNTKGAADYVAKVIEISNANTNSAFEFLTHLAGTKSLSEIVQLSVTHGRKSFEATSTQNRELWVLAQKVAKETAEPIKKSFAKVLQKAS